MVSKFRYNSFKQIEPRGARAVLEAAARAAWARADRDQHPPIVLLAMFGVYALSGPIGCELDAKCAASRVTVRRAGAGVV